MTKLPCSANFIAVVLSLAQPAMLAACATTQAEQKAAPASAPPPVPAAPSVPPPPLVVPEPTGNPASAGAVYRAKMAAEARKLHAACIEGEAFACSDLYVRYGTTGAGVVINEEHAWQALEWSCAVGRPRLELGGCLGLLEQVLNPEAHRLKRDPARALPLAAEMCQLGEQTCGVATLLRVQPDSLVSDDKAARARLEPLCAAGQKEACAPPDVVPDDDTLLQGCQVQLDPARGPRVSRADCAAAIAERFMLPPARHDIAKRFSKLACSEATADDRWAPRGCLNLAGLLRHEKVESAAAEQAQARGCTLLGARAEKYPACRPTP